MTCMWIPLERYNMYIVVLLLHLIHYNCLCPIFNVACYHFSPSQKEWRFYIFKNNSPLTSHLPLMRWCTSYNHTNVYGLFYTTSFKSLTHHPKLCVWTMFKHRNIKWDGGSILLNTFVYSTLNYWTYT